MHPAHWTAVLCAGTLKSSDSGVTIKYVITPSSTEIPKKTKKCFILPPEGTVRGGRLRKVWGEFDPASHTINLPPGHGMEGTNSYLIFPQSAHHATGKFTIFVDV